MNCRHAGIKEYYYGEEIKEENMVDVDGGRHYGAWP